MKKKNFYLFYTSDSSLLNNELKKLENSLNISEENIIEYNIEEIDNIIEEALTISLFSPNKFIIIDATIFLSDKKNINNIEKLEKYFDNYNDTCYMVFVSKKDTIDNRKKIVKFVNSNGIIKKLEINSSGISEFISKYIKDNNYVIDITNIKYLQDRIGNNVDNLKNELDKLMTYKIDEKKITKDDIDKLTIENRENTIFDLVSAILKKEHKKALSIYYNYSEKQSESYSLIPLLSKQIQLLFQVKRLSEEGKNNNEISNILGFKNPFRVKYLLKDSYYYTENDLINLIKVLANLDKNIKSGMIDNKIAIELFISGKDN